jgi:hypothetical protein
MSKNEAIRSSFYEFVKEFWIYAEPAFSYKDNWHIEAITDHLQACYTGDIKNLVINAPPAMGKSLILSVLFPCWVWIKDPSKKFLYQSSDGELQKTFHDACTRALESPLYLTLGGKKILSRDRRSLIIENESNGRISRVGNSRQIGPRAWAVIADEPNSEHRIKSLADRETTNESWKIYSKYLENREEGIRIISQKRLHVNDVTGYELKTRLKNIVHLSLPMEFEPKKRCSTIILPGKKEIWKDPRSEEGELLWPEGYSEKFAQEDKENLYDWHSQYQQNPVPEDGIIFKEEGFQQWKDRELPPFELIVQSWDTATAVTEKAGYTACTTWGVFKGDDEVSQALLLSLWYEKVKFPDLEKMAIRLANNYNDNVLHAPIVSNKNTKPDIILIEERQSGYPLIQILSREKLSIVPFNPQSKGRSRTSKEGRARIAASIIEGERVWLKVTDRNSRLFLEACRTFPHFEESKDIIDTLSQVLIFLKDNRWDKEEILSKVRISSFSNI